MKKLAVLILLLSASTQAMAADLCTTLQGKRLSINGNGYANGVTGKIVLQGPQNGTYSFQTTVQFPGEPADKVAGTCKNRRIAFARTRPGSFVQGYDGWIFEKNPNGMAGVFSAHWNLPKQYGWYAQMQPVAN